MRYRRRSRASERPEPIRLLGALAADPANLGRIHAERTGLDHAYRDTGLTTDDGCEPTLFFSPREAARICAAEVTASAPVGAVVVLDPACSGPNWSRQTGLRVDDLLRAHVLPRS